MNKVDGDGSNGDRIMFDLSDEDLKWMTKIHELNGAKIVCHLFPEEGGADEP